MSASAPQLSVVLTTRCDTQSLRLVLRCLRAQTVAPSLECIVVAHPDAGLHLSESELAGLHEGKILNVAAATSEGGGKAAGVAAARAAFIAFTEDHCYPHSTWAEALLRAHHAGDYAAVGPVVGNANWQSNVGWGGFLLFYAPFLAAPPDAQVEHLPGNQSCYRREVLLGYGERLAELLECESLLHWDLRRRGFRLRQEPAARVYHLNYARISPLLEEAHWASRAFAAQRASGWGVGKKAVYALGCPLLPAIRLRRILADVRRAALASSLVWRALPALGLALCASAAGEMLGYARGEAGARERIFRGIERPHGSLTPEVLDSVLRNCDAG